MCLININSNLALCGTVDLLYSFNGTVKTEITIPDVSIYKQLMFGLWVSAGDAAPPPHAQFIATAIIPRSTFVSGHRSVKIFGGVIHQLGVQ